MSESSMQPNGKGWNKFWFACAAIGVIGGGIRLCFWLSGIAVASATPPPLPPPGDLVTSVTSTFAVFGVAVKESSGPWAEHSQRFGKFQRSVALGFVAVWLLAALAIYLVVMRARKPLGEAIRK